jgi:hypothetical protein
MAVGLKSRRVGRHPARRDARIAPKFTLECKAPLISQHPFRLQSRCVIPDDRMPYHPRLILKRARGGRLIKEDYDVIADDQVVVRIFNAGIWAAGSPWF